MTPADECLRRRDTSGFLVCRTLCILLPLLLLVAGSAVAQDRSRDNLGDQGSSADYAAAIADSANARADSASAAADTVPQVYSTTAGAASTSTSGLFTSFKNTPKAGVRANVRQNNYYGELTTNLSMRGGSIANNRLNWSYDQYRKQDKTVETRGLGLDYNTGSLLPASVRASGKWNWSEDKTVNTTGSANVAKRDFKSGTVSVSKPRMQAGMFLTTLSAAVGINDQKANDQNVQNDFNEASVDGHLQTGARVARGVTIAGRLYAKSLGGDRSLGTSTSPSSANSDSMGIGIYYDRTVAVGRVAITRSNFDKKYLDFNRDQNGQVDTLTPGVEKYVEELETKDAISIEFENRFQIGRIDLRANLSRDINEQDYAISKAGLKERQQDRMNLAASFGAGRDSFEVAYVYGYKWDDQKLQDATERRGRKYTKDRDYEFTWYRDLFTATDLTVKYHQGLTQDTAENQYNDNDKDRLETDLSLKLGRNWNSGFRVNLGFNWKGTQDLNIRASRSSTNNHRDSYEVAPGYTWILSPWLTLSQNYRLYIQYTDYVFSHLPDVNREDNYNKRGNLNTSMVIKPSSRLRLNLKYDYNKRFNATKTATDVTGGSKYRKDLIQTIGRVDLAVSYTVAEGVTLEGATYRNRDAKDNIGSTTKTTVNHAGEMWLGCKISQKWGTKHPLELSATIKKYNAYGPSVTETSSDYWEADAWLKWEF